MGDSALNIVDPATRDPSATPGDVPERLRRRYLTEDRNGSGLGFYVDAAISRPAFRDHGLRLSTDRNDPHVIRDLVAIAQHRHWSSISVRGQTGFRREVWITARAAGLEVRGYQPSARDLQDLARRTANRSERSQDPRQNRSSDPQGDAAVQARLRIVEAVVKARIVEPATQARILAAARGRIADWLERGARFDNPRDHKPPDAAHRERRR